MLASKPVVRSLSYVLSPSDFASCYYPPSYRYNLKEEDGLSGSVWSRWCKHKSTVDKNRSYPRSSILTLFNSHQVAIAQSRHLSIVLVSSWYALLMIYSSKSLVHGISSPISSTTSHSYWKLKNLTPIPLKILLPNAGGDYLAS